MSHGIILAFRWCSFSYSNEEISEILKICNEHKVPVTAFGTGTCLEGNVIPTSGGIVVDMEKMNSVLRVSQEDLDCTVQARVTRNSSMTILRI